MVDKNQEFKDRIYRFTLRLIKFLGSVQRDLITKEIISQLMRSGTSIGANYFEAQSASSKKDFINYFNHALKSANESVFWINLLINGNLVQANLLNECRLILKETE
ncbi:MAG: four helix bundle protein [Candidatus Omnitrophica bacterium]|nr:four helix bundle protein [Candidatus Omnitrophota bacterium]